MGFLGFPAGSDGKESACNAGGPGVRSLNQEDPLEKGLATPVFLSGESHGQGSLGGLPSMGSQTEQLSLSRRLTQEAPPHQATRGQHLPAPAHPRGAGLGEEADAGSASSTPVSSPALPCPFSPAQAVGARGPWLGVLKETLQRPNHRPRGQLKTNLARTAQP